MPDDAVAADPVVILQAAKKQFNKLASKPDHVFQHYRFIELEDQEGKAWKLACRYCGLMQTSYRGGSRSGTSNFLNHIDTHKEVVPNKRRKLNSNLKGFFEPENLRLHAKVVMYVLRSKHGYSVAENPELLSILRESNPQ